MYLKKCLLYFIKNAISDIWKEIRVVLGNKLQSYIGCINGEHEMKMHCLLEKLH